MLTKHQLAPKARQLDWILTFAPLLPLAWLIVSYSSDTMELRGLRNEHAALVAETRDVTRLAAARSMPPYTTDEPQADINNVANYRYDATELLPLLYAVTSKFGSQKPRPRITTIAYADHDLTIEIVARDEVTLNRIRDALREAKLIAETEIIKTSVNEVSARMSVRSPQATSADGKAK